MHREIQKIAVVDVTREDNTPQQFRTLHGCVVKSAVSKSARCGASVRRCAAHNYTSDTMRRHGHASRRTRLTDGMFTYFCSRAPPKSAYVPPYVHAPIRPPSYGLLPATVPHLPRR